MIRSSLLRKTPLRSTSSLSRGSALKTTKPLARTGSLKRTKLKWKPRKLKPGQEPLYKAWIKTQVCCVGGKRCGKVDPHHIIDGKGDAKKGMGQTAPDRFLLPLCRAHHDQFHDRKGFCFGWEPERRLSFQEQECERLREVWADLQNLDVLQEPLRKAI